MNKCVFLDRDGILNKEIGRYVYDLCDFEITEGIIDTLKELKKKNYLLIVITNQGGISRGTYTHKEVELCHAHFQQESDNLIDEFYYSPYASAITNSLSGKPGSLMFEKAIAKYNIDPGQSWMIGDKERDAEPAKKLGMKTIKLHIEEYMDSETTIADYKVNDLREVLGIIK